MKIRELLTDETKWTKGSDSKTPNGHWVDPNSSHASCWCLRGAAMRCYPEVDEFLDVFQKMDDHLRKFGRFGPVGWNDAPERTFADVRKLIEELDV